MQLDFNLAVDFDEEALITAGATLGIFLALMVYFDSRDEVVLINAVFDAYLAVVFMAGGVPTQIRATDNDGHYFVTTEVVERAITTGPKQ